MVTNLKKHVPLILATTIVLLTSITFYLIGSSQTAESVIADETSSEVENNSGTNHINNSIENNVNGDNAQIDNSIENHVYSGSENEIDNSVTNNMDIKVDVQITNNVVNQIESNENGAEEGETNNDTNGTSNGNTNGENRNANDDEATNGTTGETVWGVDSASLTTDNMLNCVYDNFGDPHVWGRYLIDRDGVSYGLTEEEITLLHENDIQILVIWNHFNDATGYDKGVSEATEAIEAARHLGIPEGVALFANVEPIYPIDHAFLLGWYDTLANSEYTSGVYGIFAEGEELSIAYEAAVAERGSSYQENNYLWTAAPNVGITTEANAPDYQPEAPEGALIAGWQYGIDAETCNIDTNHFLLDVMDIFW